jgi:hypothetical protein
MTSHHYSYPKVQPIAVAPTAHPGGRPATGSPAGVVLSAPAA